MQYGPKSLSLDIYGIKLWIATFFLKKKYFYGAFAIISYPSNGAKIYIKYVLCDKGFMMFSGHWRPSFGEW